VDSPGPPTPELPESGPDAIWRRRIACAEINGRRVNEAIERGRSRDSPGAYLCECGRVDCNLLLDLPVSKYESVRSSFDRFLLADGHEITEVDKVIERHDTHLVVVKDGEAGDMARRTDERTHADDHRR
jgi:hypothetical protein